MSKQQKAPQMIEVVALHDLNYVDHTGGSVYRRQSSKPFQMDEKNVRRFLPMGAIKVVDEFVAAEDLTKGEGEQKAATESKPAAQSAKGASK